jgi:hypothetical protein
MKIKMLLTILFLGSVAYADHHEGDAKPGMFVSQTSTMNAVVEAIDHEARLVTLRREDGTSVTLTPSPDVRNLDQVDVGDVLHVEYQQSVTIQVADLDNMDPAAAEVAGITRSEAGEMPAMAAVDTRVLLARVVAIDIPNMTYKLELPDGMVNEYVALVKENLEMAAVGDTVVVEVTEMITAVVEDLTPSE